MKQEFNLSEKIFKDPEMFVLDWVIEVKNVKEFIKLVKEEFEKWGTELMDLQEVTKKEAIEGKAQCLKCRENFIEIIDKLAGERLI